MKGRKHRGTGGVNEEKADVDTKPEARANASKEDKEAEERKHGGRAKHKHGGEVKAHGSKHHGHMGRKPRKSGGRTGSDSSPLTSSHSGKTPAGRSVMSESMD